jgi:polar amino acid transport system substrate-binding protein
MSNTVARTTSVWIVLLAVATLAQDDGARRQLMPTGKLRVGLNYGNQLLVGRDRAQPQGVAIDLAHELARRLGTEPVFIGYATPGEVTEGVGKDWDIAFVAADPDRAQAIAFTPPYLEIDATYLVPASSSVRRVGDMDRVGAKIATGATSAYTLVLKRELKQAQLVLLANDAAVSALQGATVDAIAGLRFALLQTASRIPGSRVLPDSFTRAQQAVAVPKANAAALAYLSTFVADVKRSGFVTAAIEKTGLAGATVAPINGSR